MAFGTIGAGVGIQTYLKFVECCSGTEILFSGSLAVTNGSVYLYGGTVPFSGTGGSLQPGRCYTITTITASGVITYPVTPPIALISLTSGCGAEACFNCNPANPCDCPEGYEIIDGFCVGVESIDPIPPKTIVFTGNDTDPGGGAGLVTFQSLNNFVWPLFTTPQLIADVAAMTIIPNTGNNPVTGDSWTALNPLPQTGINAGKHQPITTATPGGFPALPSPPNPPTSFALRPLRESTITGTTLNYGGGNPIGYDNYEIATPPWDDWYDDVAVWSLPGISVENQYAGFLVCLEPAVETTYQVIMTCNNGLRLFVDDYLAVEMLNGNNYFQALAYNNHFQITLSPGLHILRLECYNYSLKGGLAAEVLECSAATVYGFTSLADFIPYRKFSTLWKKSRNLQITGTGTNIITLTSGTTLPSDTSGFIVQTSGTGFPANTFVISVINSTTYIVNQNVPNGVYNSCRIQFAYDVSSIANNSFSCPEGFTLTTCDGIACVRTVELPCSSNCYLVIPCDNEDSFVSNSFDLEEFVDSFVTVETDNFYGCAYIVKLDENDCRDAVEVTLYPDEVCDCDLRCFYVSNSNGFLYVDENDVLQEVSSVEANPYIKVCSKVYPVVQNDSRNYEIINFGNCVNNTCPEQCFKLTKCATNPETIIYSNTASLLEHAVNNNIITINGEEGCWEVTESIANCDCITVTFTGPFGTDTYTANSIGTYNGANLYQFTANNGDILYIWFFPEKGWFITANGYGDDPAAFEVAFTPFNGNCPDSVNEDFNWVPSNFIEDTIETEVCPAECDCPIPVTVLESYPTCEECLPIVNYKFTNCNNKSIIRYSIDDYSAYVGQTVELECGECWLVSEINYIPPSTQSIVILYTFDGCPACNRTYYKLTDCLEPENITYTYTDLSIYVDQVIKIKGCDTCFTVEETREPINAGIVTVTDSYLDCPECLETFPCVCNRITNQDTIAKDFTYLDCLFDEVTINLQPNETSEKVCLINWVLTPEEEALVYIEHFGDCINGQCPVVPLPKRKVKPGYSTPSCDIEKYEKITCKSSEILYKQVIRLRYGISNCCPEDEEKWLIKKELIDLDALRDPDYICRPVTSCCNQPINDCGCNTLKTCNS